MKILFINNFLGPPGGVETLLYSEASLLKEKGYEVHFFAVNRAPFFEENYEYRHFFPDYIDFKSLTGIQKLKYLNIFYNFEAKKKLNKCIKEIKPDLIHIHNYSYYLTSSIIEELKKHKIPVVQTVHDFRFVCPGGILVIDGQICQNIECLKGNKLHCVANRCKNNRFIDSLFVYIEYLINKSMNIPDRIDKFIFPAQASYELFVKNGFDKQKCIVINNFVNDMFLDLNPDYTNKGYFLYAGRLSVEKGLKNLIKAFSELPEEIQLRIAGTGPEEEKLKKLAENLNCKNIQFAGLKYGNDLIDEYQHSIAAILPCEWFETFGITLLEAFAAGKPVIASRAGAIPEIVEEGKTGLLVTPGDIEELKQAILQFYSDIEKTKTMGRQAREHVVEKFSSDIHLKKLISLYGDQCIT